MLDPLNSIGLFFAGSIGDTLSLTWLTLPLGVLLFLPATYLKKKATKWALLIAGTMLNGILLFDFIAEYLFWDEFSSRFNFIAVDYLIYSKELIGLVTESYPMPLIIGAIGLFTAVIVHFISKLVEEPLKNVTDNDRFIMGGIFAVALILSTTLSGSIQTAMKTGNRYNSELAGNGPYCFVKAFFANVLNYDQFYTTMDVDTAFEVTRAMIGAPPKMNVRDTLRTIDKKMEKKSPKLNVMLIMVESLSREFLGCFGNKRNITPNLDTLYENSLFFENCHATGTRTCRGLEALVLSIPPTPGRSIVKRENNENMFSSAFVLDRHAYESTFIYAGFGYFDNMNYFMSNNGFAIVDRNNFAKDEITFANVWGVCDEDLYDKAIQVSDSAASKGKLFFNHILTTSNHRPYTYPSGKIDIPSGTGRAGAVKYTDFAIGQFIEKCRRKPWFKDTLFVIVADHCAGSAGKSKISADKYLIPLIFYCPAHMKPEKITRVCSQMDTVPTILGLLNISYNSRFYGQDLLAPDTQAKERAFIGNYQYLGNLSRDTLTVLGPNRQDTSYSIREDGSQLICRTSQDLLTDTIAAYETAAWMYQHGRYTNE